MILSPSTMQPLQAGHIDNCCNKSTGLHLLTRIEPNPRIEE